MTIEIGASGSCAARAERCGLDIRVLTARAIAGMWRNDERLRVHVAWRMERATKLIALLDVLELRCGGATNLKVANALGVSVEAARRYASQIPSELGRDTAGTAYLKRKLGGPAAVPSDLGPLLSLAEQDLWMSSAERSALGNQNTRESDRVVETLDAISLRLARGLDLQACAKVMGCDPSTVQKRLDEKESSLGLGCGHLAYLELANWVSAQSSSVRSLARSLQEAPRPLRQYVLDSLGVAPRAAQDILGVELLHALIPNLRWNRSVPPSTAGRLLGVARALRDVYEVAPQALASPSAFEWLSADVRSHISARDVRQTFGSWSMAIESVVPEVSTQHTPDRIKVIALYLASGGRADAGPRACSSWAHNHGHTLPSGFGNLTSRTWKGLLDKAVAYVAASDLSARYCEVESAALGQRVSQIELELLPGPTGRTVQRPKICA